MTVTSVRDVCVLLLVGPTTQGIEVTANAWFREMLCSGFAYRGEMKVED